MRHSLSRLLKAICGLAPLSACCLVCGFGVAIAGPTESGTDWVCRYFDQARLLVPAEGFLAATAPPERLDILRWLEELDPGEAGYPARTRWLLAVLRQELAPEAAFRAAGKPVWVADAGLDLQALRGSKPVAESRVKFWFYAPSGLTLWTSFQATANAADRHRVETRPWRERWHASFSRGGIGYSRGSLSIFAGRDEAGWGASRDTGLLFAGGAPAMDLVKLGVGTRRVLLTALHSQLRPGRSDPWGAGVRRFVAAHRLEVLLGRHWDVALSEAVLYGGEGRTFEPGYLNPLAPLYAEQWNTYRNDNLFVGGDVRFSLPGRGELRAEVVIDDFQIDPDSEPNEVGFGIWADAINPWLGDRSVVSCSYVRVANRTYGHAIAWNRFVQEGQVMGFPGGPDGDSFCARSTWAPWNSVEVAAGYSLTRRGEGRVDDSQDQPGRRTKFPSGVVETEHRLAADVAWRPFYSLDIHGCVGWSSTHNAGNTDGRTRSGIELSVALAYDLRVWQSGD